MPFFHRLKKEVGESVLKKHGHVCQECGNKEKLCVHHIKRMRIDDPRYQDDLDLTVLCQSCHMSLHRKAGHIIAPPPPPGNKWGRRGKGVAPVYCSESGCDRLQHGKGLCKMHYQRELRKRIKEEEYLIN